MKNKMKSKLLKAITTFTSVSTAASAAMIQAGAVAAPAGTDTSSYNTISDIVFWIVWVALGAMALPCLFDLVKGQTEDDMRKRNSGIIGLVVAGACIGVSAVIKNVAFG